MAIIISDEVAKIIKWMPEHEMGWCPCCNGIAGSCGPPLIKSIFSNKEHPLRIDCKGYNCPAGFCAVGSLNENNDTVITSLWFRCNIPPEPQQYNVSINLVEPYTNISLGSYAIYSSYSKKDDRIHDKLYEPKCIYAGEAKLELDFPDLKQFGEQIKTLVG